MKDSVLPVVSRFLDIVNKKLHFIIQWRLQRAAAIVSVLINLIFKLRGVKINEISKTNNEVLSNGSHIPQIQNKIVFSRLLVKYTKTQGLSFIEVISVIS
jgi:hypothetical protein